MLVPSVVVKGLGQPTNRVSLGTRKLFSVPPNNPMYVVVKCSSYLLMARSAATKKWKRDVFEKIFTMG